MLNQTFLYIAYGVGALFLIGGTVLLIGILKPSKEKSSSDKAAKLAAKQAREEAKKEKNKSKFGAGNRKKEKEFFTTNNIGENDSGFVLEETTTTPSTNFQTPTSNIPPKSSFQAKAFATKNPKNNEPPQPTKPTYNMETEVDIPAPNFASTQPNVEVEEELPQPKPATKSVFGNSSGFKLSEGSDDNSDSNKEGNRFNLPF
jgi:hypothetical protein